MPIALQGHNGLDGLKGQPGAQGVKVNTELRTRFVSNSFKSSNTTKAISLKATHISKSVLSSHLFFKSLNGTALRLYDKRANAKTYLTSMFIFKKMKNSVKIFFPLLLSSSYNVIRSLQPKQR